MVKEMTYVYIDNKLLYKGKMNDMDREVFLSKNINENERMKTILVKVGNKKYYADIAPNGFASLNEIKNEKTHSFYVMELSDKMKINQTHLYLEIYYRMKHKEDMSKGIKKELWKHLADNVCKMIKGER